jgi:uncharacterized protein YwgA
VIQALKYLRSYVSEAMFPERVSCLAWIVKSSGIVKGDTRLQKLAFLVAKRVKGVDKVDFYHDWRPGKFGPVSKDLYNDIKNMANSPDKPIQVWDAPLISKERILDRSVRTYVLTEAGKVEADRFRQRRGSLSDSISRLVTQYANAELMEIVHDVYYQYPEYTSQSTIKGQVGLKDSLLDPSFD